MSKQIEIITLSDSDDEDSESQKNTGSSSINSFSAADYSEGFKNALEKINEMKFKMSQPWPPIIQRSETKAKKKRFKKVNKENGVKRGPLDNFVVRSPKSNNICIDNQVQFPLDLLPNLDTGEIEAPTCQTPIKRMKLSENSTTCTPKTQISKKPPSIQQKLMFSSEKKVSPIEDKAFLPPCRKKLILQPLLNKTELDGKVSVISDNPKKTQRDTDSEMELCLGKEEFVCFKESAYRLSESLSPDKKNTLKNEKCDDDCETLVNLVQKIEINDTKPSFDFKPFAKLPNSPKTVKYETILKSEDPKKSNLLMKPKESLLEVPNFETKIKLKPEGFIERKLRTVPKTEKDIIVIDLDDSSGDSPLPFHAKLRLEPDVDTRCDDATLDGFSESEDEKKSITLTFKPKTESFQNLNIKIEDKINRHVALQKCKKEIPLIDLDWLPDIDDCNKESSVECAKLILGEHNYNHLEPFPQTEDQIIDDNLQKSPKMILFEEETLDSFPQMKKQKLHNEIIINDIDSSSQGSRLQLEEDSVDTLCQRETEENQHELNINSLFKMNAINFQSSSLQLERHGTLESNKLSNKYNVENQLACSDNWLPNLDNEYVMFEPESVPSTSTSKVQKQLFSLSSALEAAPYLPFVSQPLNDSNVNSLVNSQLVLPKVKELKLVRDPYSPERKKKNAETNTNVAQYLALEDKFSICPKYDLSLSRVYSDLCENSVVTENLPRMNNLIKFYRIIELAESDNSYSLGSVLSIINGNALPIFIVKLLIERITNCTETLSRDIFNTLIQSLRVLPLKNPHKSIDFWSIINKNVTEFINSLSEREKFSEPAVYLVKFLVTVLATDIQRRTTAARPNKLQSSFPSKFFGSNNNRILCIAYWYGDILRLLSDKDSLLSTEDEVFILETIETLIKVALVTRIEYIELNKVIARELLSYFQEISIERKERFLQLMLNMRLIRYFMCVEILTQNYGFHKEPENILSFNFTNVIVHELCKIGTQLTLNNQLEYLLLLRHLICDFAIINKEQLHWPIYARKKPVVVMFPKDVQYALKCIGDFMETLEVTFGLVNSELLVHPMCQRLFRVLKCFWFGDKCN